MSGATEVAPPPSPAGSPAVTADAFLGGKVEALQPAAGHHRSGLEAVLLAASLDSRIAGTVVDLGAGAGVAAGSPVDLVSFICAIVNRFWTVQ